MDFTKPKDSNSPYVLFDYSPEAIIVTNADFMVVYSNPIACKLFGRNENELNGLSFSSLLTFEESEKFYEKFHLRFNHNPDSVLVDVTEGSKRNGKTFPTELFVSRYQKDNTSYNIIFLRNLDIRQKYSDELHLLQILTKDISNANSFYEAIQLIIKNICIHFSWDYGEAWIVTDDKQYFIYESGWQKEGANVEKFMSESSKLKIPLDKGLPLEVSKGKLVWETAISSYNSGFQRADLAREVYLSTCVGVPIKTEKELLACILFFSKELKERDNSVISILTSISHQLAILLEKKKAEDELKEREYFIKQITEISPNIISVYDIIKNKSIYTNKELTASLGYTHEDLLKYGNDIFKQLVFPDDIPRVLNRNEKYKTLKDNESLELEIRLKTKSGELRWINTRTKIFKRTEEGIPWITISSAIDVTDSVNDKIKLRESEQALRALNTTLEQKVRERTSELRRITLELQNREELLSLITNSVPAFISYIDTNLVYKFTNDHYKNLEFGDQDLTGRKIIDVLTEKNYNHVISYLNLAFQGEKISYENSVTLKDGSQKNIYVTLIPDRNEKDEIRGVVVLGIDLAERMEFEKKLREQNIQLKKINRDLDSFVYIASHDLKAPISNIQGLIKLVCYILEEQNKLDKEIDSILHMMKESADRFNNTIKSLTDVSRIQRNYNEDLAIVDIGSVLEEVKRDLKILIKETDALIKERIENCPKISFSKSNFKTIIYNLILNSIQYRNPGRPLSIIVSCTEVDDYYLLEFIDNGIGIKKENQEKVFQLFRRYNTMGQGTGVGLYIVKRIVEDTGGKIELKSEENKGSTFKLYIRKI